MRAFVLTHRCPVFVPERSRKPLTEVQQFGFKVDIRAVERADFDKKVCIVSSIHLDSFYFSFSTICFVLLLKKSGVINNSLLQILIIGRGLNWSRLTL